MNSSIVAEKSRVKKIAGVKTKKNSGLKPFHKQIPRTHLQSGIMKLGSRRGAPPLGALQLGELVC
jgi:hypothetical protein